MLIFLCIFGPGTRMHVLGSGIEPILYGRFLACMLQIWPCVLHTTYLHVSGISCDMPRVCVHAKREVVPTQRIFPRTRSPSTWDGSVFGSHQKWTTLWAHRVGIQWAHNGGDGGKHPSTVPMRHFRSLVEACTRKSLVIRHGGRKRTLGILVQGKNRRGHAVSQEFNCAQSGVCHSVNL